MSGSSAEPKNVNGQGKGELARGPTAREEPEESAPPKKLKSLFQPHKVGLERRGARTRLGRSVSARPQLLEGDAGFVDSGEGMEAKGGAENKVQGQAATETFSRSKVQPLIDPTK
jgi:hypothetical protein